MFSNKASLLSFILALLYVGTATIQLISIMTGDGQFLQSLDAFFMPGYLIGFALGFTGGDSWAMIGQVITFFAAWGIVYVWMKAMNGVYHKLVKQN